MKFIPKIQIVNQQEDNINFNKFIFTGLFDEGGLFLKTDLYTNHILYGKENEQDNWSYIETKVNNRENKNYHYNWIIENCNPIKIENSDWSFINSCEPLRGFGARITDGKLEMASSVSGVSGAAGACAFITGIENFNYPLKNNSDIIEWSFEMNHNMPNSWTIRGINQPNTNANGFILLGSTPRARDFGSGYAVIHGSNDGLIKNIRLVKYSGGLVPGDSNVTDIITGSEEFENEIIQIKVTYDSSNDEWSLYTRNDGNGFLDPLAPTGFTYNGSYLDDTFVNASDLIYCGAYFQGIGIPAESGYHQVFFDNFKIQKNNQEIFYENFSQKFYIQTGSKEQWDDKYTGYNFFKSETTSINNGKIYRISNPGNIKNDYVEFDISNAQGEFYRPIKT